MSTEIILGEESSERRIRINSENPKLERIRQVGTLARLFAEKLGLSREAYINSLPEFGPKPESFKDLYVPAVPILVDPRVDLSDLLDIVGISSFFDPKEIKGWTEGVFGTQKEPYATWLTYIPNASVIEICADLLKHEDRRGGTPFDGIMLYLRDPYILNDYFLGFPGSRVGPEDAPFLSGLPNSVRTQPPAHPSLHYGFVESKSPKFACVIASKI